MARNDPTPKAAVRQPRGAVLINGQAAPFTEMNVDTNGFAEADTCDVSLPISELPDGLTVADLMAAEKIELELKAGFPADPAAFTVEDLETIFVGNADSLDIDIIANTIRLHGRDFTALLIDAKTSEQYRNQTASQVVETIAGEHGLTPVVTATTNKLGTYYQIDHVRQQRSRTKWDLLTWLAGEEDYIVYVSGRELRFGPRPDAGKDPYVFELQPSVGAAPREGNFSNIRFGKQLSLTKGIKVEVRSWNARRGAAVIKTFGGGANAQFYRYSIPGLTPEQAQARAESIHGELSHHQVQLGIDGPADNILGIDDVISVRGTPFDQVFYPDSIRRTLDDRGYSWSIEAKNRSRTGGEAIDEEATP